MNRKQLTFLLVTVVVMGAAGLMVYKKQNAGTKGADPALGNKLLGDFPVNDVGRIVITNGTGELDLVKTNDRWQVVQRNGYPANFSEISGLLLKLRDLKIVQTEQVGPSQLPRLSLAPGQGTNSPTVLEFKDQKEKPMQTLLLGKKHMRKSTRPSPMGDMGDEGWPDGRYVRVGSQKTVALVSDALSNVEPNPEQWLNKDFFKVEKVRSIAVTFPNPTNSWKLSRDTETAEWKLAEPKPDEELDSGKTSGLATALGSPSFSDVVVDPKPEELGLDKPTLVNIDTFDDFAYALNVGSKTNSNYALAVSVSAQIPKERTAGEDEKAEDKERLDKEFKEKVAKLEEKLAAEKSCEKWTYLVSSWTFDSLLKERSQLLKEKKAEEKPDEEPATATPSTAGDGAEK